MASHEGQQDLCHNWHRLGEVCRFHFPQALERVLDLAMKTDSNYSHDLTFEQNLSKVLEFHRSKIMTSLADKRDLSKIYPTSDSVGSFANFDVIIIRKLVMYLYGHSDHTSAMKDDLIKAVNRSNSSYHIGEDFEGDLRNALENMIVTLIKDKKEKKIKKAKKFFKKLQGARNLTCLDVYELTQLFFPVPKITVGNDDRANPDLATFDFASANHYHMIMSLYKLRNKIAHCKGFADSDFQIFWEFLNRVLEQLRYDTSLIQSIKTYVFDDAMAKEQELWANGERKFKALAELRKICQKELDAFELNQFGEPNDEGIKKRDLRVSLVTVKAKSPVPRGKNDIVNNPKVADGSSSENQLFEISSLLEMKSTALIQGVPGIGKSTLCHTIWSEWLEEKIWKDKYDLVLYVNCGELIWYADESPTSSPVDDSSKKNERVKSPLEKMYGKVFADISLEELLNQGVKCAVIVDSIDEIDVTRICSSKPALKIGTVEHSVRSIITETRLDRIIVGRDYACYQVQQTFLRDKSFQHVEVVGFSKDLAEQYVLRFFKENAQGKDVWKQVCENPSLSAMFEVPIFACILCFLFEEKQIKSMPTTKTELYVWNYIGFMLRHYRDQSQKSRLLEKDVLNLKTCTLSELLNNEAILTDLRALCKMAHDNFMDGKIYFEAPDNFSQTFFKCFMHKRKKFVTFSHLTLLEFFTAVELLLCGKKIQIKNFSKNKRFHVVLEIYWGLRGASLDNSNSPDIIKEFINPLLSICVVAVPTTHPLNIYMGSRFLMRQNRMLCWSICYEFRNETCHKYVNRELVLRKMASIIGVVSYTPIHHYQLEHFLYFLKNFVGHGSFVSLAFNLVDRNITEDECIKFVEVTKSSKNPHALRMQIERLDMSYCGLNDAKLDILSTVLVQSRVLDLSHNSEITRNGWEKFALHLKSSSENKSLKLVHLRLSGCSNALILELLLAFPYISMVDLSGGKTSIFHPAHLMNETEWPRCYLDLSRSGMNDDSLEHLSPVLPSIGSVNLANNGLISSNGWNSLANAIRKEKDNKSLKMNFLDLSYCRINDETMAHFVEVLPFIREVHLAGIHMNAFVCEQLAQRIIERAVSDDGLDMETLDCNLDDDSLIKLAPAIPYLAHINLARNTISHEALERIVSSVEECPKEKLKLLEISPSTNVREHSKIRFQKRHTHVQPSLERMLLQM